MHGRRCLRCSLRQLVEVNRLRLLYGLLNGQPGSSTQTVAVVALHNPVTGQSTGARHTVAVDRLQEPLVSGAAMAPRQSPSQASPIPSRSISVCTGLAVRTQLSF